jgi:hypothetical protein
VGYVCRDRNGPDAEVKRFATRKTRLSPARIRAEYLIRKPTYLSKKNIQISIEAAAAGHPL